MEAVIKAWINGTRSYGPGVQLYLQYGTDDDLKTFFMGEKTPFREKKLLEELTLLFRFGANAAPSGNNPVEASDVKTAAPTDESLLRLYNKKIALYREKDLLRSRLESYQSDFERGIAAHRILQLRREISAIWAAEEYFRTHGRMPEQSAGQVTSERDIKYQITLANGNLRRIRAQLKKDPTNSRYLKGKAKWEAKWEELKQLARQANKIGI